MDKHYSINDRLILRSPLFPFQSSFTVYDLREFFKLASVKEALFLSSPNLLLEIEKWADGKLKDEEKKLIITILKYTLRAHTRCTPFGLFAGCSVINWGNENNISLRIDYFKRNTRLDMNYTCVLAQELSKKAHIQPFLKFFPNSSIYRVYDKIRFVDYYYSKMTRKHQISEVDNSEYLQNVLLKAEKGANIAELVNVLINEEINFDEAYEFISEIINSQLLVSELEPSLTGGEFLSQIILTLSNIKQKSLLLDNSLTILNEVKNQIKQIDTRIGNDSKVYLEIATRLNALNVPYEINKLFQTDYFKKTEIGTLNSTLKSQIKKALRILNKLTIRQENPNLKKFKDEFSRRYEEREVALLQVLDNDTGIGYASKNNHAGGILPLVDNFVLPYINSNNIDLKWNKTHSFLLRKLIKANEEKSYTINIEEAEINDFVENWNDLPLSFSVMFNHVGKKGDKDLIYIESVGGASAVNLLGRFGSGSQEIENLTKEIAKKEQQLFPDKIFASILHLPENRTGNIISRPIIRDYEIPYLAKSGYSKEKQIAPDDLMVSIRGNEIILRSKSLNKEIIPCLDNAHNYTYNSLPVYHFLCDLQTQNKKAGLIFDWGGLKNEYRFLPRIEIDNIILSPASWLLEKNDYPILNKTENSPVSEIKVWQKKWNLPNLILLVDGDNELLINLTDELNVMMFAETINKRSSIHLKEFLFDEKNAIVKDTTGRPYTNEFILILQKNIDLPLKTKNAKNTIQSNNHKNIKRTFLIGSEWLYYKIYSGVKIADKILTEIVKPLTEKLINDKIIDSWFFIRYADPDIHLRLRFHFSNVNNLGTVIKLFEESISEYQTNHLITKLQVDTYCREIERYGSNTMEISEKLFYYDSVCAVNLLDMLEGERGAEIRWLFSLTAIDELFSCFRFTLNEKKDIIELLKNNFALEFNMNNSLKIQLDAKYREKRTIIKEFINKEHNIVMEFSSLFGHLEGKRKKILPLIDEILIKNENDEMSLPINKLASDYIHMLLNRLFQNKQRMHEMVIYYFMWRYYCSAIAVTKSKNNLLL